MKTEKKDGKINVGLTITLLRVIVGFALCIAVPMFSVPAPYSLALYAAAGLFAGIEFLASGISGVAHEDYFNRNSILLVVFIVSFIIGVGYEGVLLLIFAQLGLVLSEYVRNVSREHVLSITGLNFKTAHVYRGGILVDNFLEEIACGDEIVVRAGEYFPMDCVVMEGNSTAKAQLIDSKSLEFPLNIGDDVLAGTMNIGADVRCEVVSDGASTATDILSVLRKSEAVNEPAIMRYFQPVMMAFAVVIGFVLVLMTDVDAYDAVHRALAVVALSGALPAYAGFGDIRFAARVGAATRGAVFASDEVFMKLGHSDMAVVCADGILTEGKLSVSAAYSENLDEETFLRVAAHAMAYSNDPAAEAIMNAYDGDIIFEHIQDFREIPNCGVMIVYNGVPVVLGTQALMANVKGLLPKKMSADRQMMFLLVGKQYAGYIVLTDPISDYTDSISGDMERFGVDHLAFVTSYSAETANKISGRTGIETFEAGYSCDERMQYVEQLREVTEGKMAYFYHEKYAAEEHSAADYDICVGGKTADLLNGRAEVVAPVGRASAVFEAMECAQNAQRMCEASAYCIFAVKLLLIVFAGAGLATVWFVAAFELIASLFVKVFAANAFNESTLQRFSKKKHKEKKA